MNSSYYKYCIVPQCKSTTIKMPNKLFIYVSSNEQIRKKWLKLARRDDVHSLSTNLRMYFCADHFDVRICFSKCLKGMRLHVPRAVRVGHSVTLGVRLRSGGRPPVFGQVVSRRRRILQIRAERGASHPCFFTTGAAR
ncbi:hypothetical protein NQ317_010484 [Molorchus minor]|uniref:THAP-type domain-containing protein n=1 Tax=Molorchus minor TaxID=1323400 RepID=A0ABQ9JYF5_9CUCU|nr:hypothetical protein NQ317_010484 [Molorchus minor]